jgi:hypothetical protein
MMDGVIDGVISRYIESAYFLAFCFDGWLVDLYTNDLRNYLFP